MTPTPEDLARDPAADMVACDAATAGPWIEYRRRHTNDMNSPAYCGRPGDPFVYCYFANANENMAFVVVARGALPAWICRAVEAEADNARLRSALGLIADLQGRPGSCYEDDCNDMGNTARLALLRDGETSTHTLEQWVRTMRADLTARLSRFDGEGGSS